MQIKTYKNGRVDVKDDGIQVWIRPKDNPQVHLWDHVNRYGYVVYQGLTLGDSPTVETRTKIAIDVLNQYKTVRGQRTSWTVDDAWLRKWKAALRLERESKKLSQETEMDLSLNRIFN